jgi:glycosyltransferase involved in cell wall biosynthesis
MSDKVIALSECRDSAAVQLPMVSVVITNFNYRRYIRQAIDSVQQQSYRTFECVIVDDCSTDGSFNEIANYVHSLADSRFQVLQMDINSGQMAAIKAGMERTSGPFVLCLDGDDHLHPDALRCHLAAHLNSSYSAGVSVCDAQLIDGDNTLLQTTFHTLLKKRTAEAQAAVKPIPRHAVGIIKDAQLDLPGPPMRVQYIERGFYGWHGVATSGMMWRRELLDVVWPADMTRLRVSADYYLYHLCHLISGTIAINLPLFSYRLHRQNQFASFPLIGGFFATGPNADHHKVIEPQIVAHLVDNADRFNRLIGAQRVVEIIALFAKRWELYDHVKRSKLLRLWYGNGSEWRFAFNYGFRYRKRIVIRRLLRRWLGSGLMKSLQLAAASRIAERAR